MERKTRFQSLLVGGAALLALASFSLVAAAKLSKAGGASAGFKAVGPGGLGIDGKTSDVDVADDGSTVTITVKLGSLDVGGDLRSSHTKEDLEVSKYPTATLKVPRSALNMGGGSGDAKGQMTIHGTTKDVTFHYDAGKSGDTLDVKGKAKVNVKDFGVKPRSYLGISIKDDVDIFANFQAKDG
jgi:polyisoprenoid-binding protein YceI